MLYSDFSIDLVLKQMEEIFNKKSTPNRICCVLLEAIEIIQQLRRAAVPPPNDPLTLEELRGMDGEPVWVNFAPYGYWAVIHRGWAKFWDGDSIPIERIAGRSYRRRPEEGTV